MPIKKVRLYSAHCTLSSLSWVIAHTLFGYVSKSDPYKLDGVTTVDSSGECSYYCYIF